MGYITGPAALMNEFRKVHQFNVFSCNTPVQYALTDYLQDADTYLSLPAFYETKRNLFLDGLKGSRFVFTPAVGTYFQLLNFGNISNEKDTDLAIRWTKEQKITGIPCSVFYPEGLDQQVMRFCFAKNDETIAAAASVLRNI
jgi:methionine aminotransferase